MIDLSVDSLMPYVWVSMNQTIVNISGINNTFMIRNFVHRLERFNSINKEEEYKLEIDKSKILLKDMYSLSYFTEKNDIHLHKFLRIDMALLKIRIDVFSANNANLFHDLKEFLKNMPLRKDKKFNLFISKIYLTFLLISAISPLFLIKPKLGRMLTIRLMG